MVAEIWYKILTKMILTSNRLAWKFFVTWARKHDYIIVPKDEYNS